MIGAANTAGVTINGGSRTSDSVSINGNNRGYLTLNDGGTVKVTGNAGNGSLNGGSLTYTGSIGSWNLNGGATSSKCHHSACRNPAIRCPPSPARSRSR